MKNHDEIRSMLAALAGGDLSAADLALVEQHLALCPSCRSELAQLQLVVQAVRATPELEPPAWLASRTMVRVREEAAQQQSWFARLFLPLRIKLPLEAFALVMICVTAWYVMQEVDRSQQALQGIPVPQAPSAEPVKDAAVPSAPVSPMPESRQSLQSASPERAEQSAMPVFAPPPSVAADQSGKPEKSTSAPEPVPVSPAVTPEQAAGAPAPLAAQKKSERRMAPGRKEERSNYRLDTAVSQPLRIRLVTLDPIAFSKNLHGVVQQLGGAVVESRTGSAVVRIETRHLPELLDQLARMGRIAEHPVRDLSPGGWLELAIYWQATEK